MQNKLTKKEIVILLLLLGMTLFLRLAYLGDGYNKDESAIYHVSKDLAEGRYFQVMSWPYYSISIHVPAAILMKIFGPMPFIQRVLPAVLGTFTILVMFFFVKSMYGTGIAFASSFLFSISLWHLSVTRQGVSWTDPFFVVSGIYAFRHGVLARKNLFYILSGICFALGAHNRMYMLSGLFIVGLYSLFTQGVRRTILPAFLAGISALAVLSPIFIWNFKTGLGIFSAFESAVTSGQKFLHVGAPSSPFVLVPKKFAEYLMAANLTLSGKLAGVERSSSLSVPLIDIVFDVYVLFLIRRAWKERKEQDILLSCWFLVATLIFTFVITWKEEFFQGYTEIRPTRYLGILHPLPFIVAVLGFKEIFAWLEKRAPVFQTTYAKSLTAAGLIIFLAVIHVKIYMSVGPKTMNNLRIKDFIMRDTGNTPAYVLTNFPVGSMTAVKNFTYPLNFSEYRAMYPELGKGTPSLYDPKYLTYLFPTFFYVMAPELAFMNYAGGMDSLMSLTDLPVMSMKKIQKFSRAADKKPLNVYYVLWDEEAGDGLRGILGIDDQPIVLADVVRLFRKRNPDLKPVTTLNYNGKNDFLVFKFSGISSRRVYENVTFDFGVRDNAEPENEIKVSRGNVYMPWVGFGWRHPYFQEVRYTAQKDGLLPVYKNSFFVDVSPGDYTATFHFQTFCAPTTDVFINGKQYMDKSYTAKGCSKNDDKLRELVLPFNVQSVVVPSPAGKEKYERLVFEFSPDIYTMAFDVRASMPLSGTFWSIDKLEIKRIKK